MTVLSVLLTILKIIGIILLVILALVLLILLVILFVPFRYSAVIDKDALGPEAKMTDGLAVNARVTWLLHLISVSFGLKDGAKGLKLKVAGIDLLKNKKDKKAKKKKVKKGTARPLKEIAAGKKKKAEEEEEAPNAAEEPGKDTAAAAASVEETHAEPAGGSVEDGEKAEETPLEHLFYTIGEKIWPTLQRIAKKLKAFGRKMSKLAAQIRKYLDFAEDERTQNAIRLALAELGKILKGFLPKKISGRINYGSDDIYKTGETLAILSAVYPLYQGKVDIIPNFEEKALDGHLELAGRIRTASIVGSGLKLILNKNVKYVIGFFKNKDKKEGHLVS